MSTTYVQQYQDEQRALEEGLRKLLNGVVRDAYTVLLTEQRPSGVVPFTRAAPIAEQIRQITVQSLLVMPDCSPVTFNAFGQIKQLSPFMALVWDRFKAVTTIAAQAQATMLDRILTKTKGYDVLVQLRQTALSPFAGATTPSQVDRIRHTLTAAALEFAEVVENAAFDDLNTTLPADDLRDRLATIMLGEPLITLLQTTAHEVAKHYYLAQKIAAQHNPFVIGYAIVNDDNPCGPCRAYVESGDVNYIEWSLPPFHKDCQCRVRWNYSKTPSQITQTMRQEASEVLSPVQVEAFTQAIMDNTVRELL